MEFRPTAVMGALAARLGSAPGPVAPEAEVRLSALRRLYELIARVNGGRSLAEVLQSVVDGVVDELGFGIAVVSVVHEDRSFQVAAVAGSDEARAELLGRVSPPDTFDAEFAVAERWGSLRFVPHDRLPPEQLTGWVPPPVGGPRAAGPDAWHELDALFAPLTSPSGQLVGMLSVDLPLGGRRPDLLQRELLEMFAAQAGIAVDNARLSERLRASEASFRLAFDGAGGAMTLTSLDPRDSGRFLRVNRAMCDLVGYSAEELTAMSVPDITYKEDLPASLVALDEAVSGRASSDRQEKRYVRRDGSHVWVAITSSVIRLESGEPLYAITQVEDITSRRATEAELARRATHDPLTGLLNRAGLQDRLLRHLTDPSCGSRDGSAAPGLGALLYCDLDGFKAVNDNHGHAFGDQVLCVVAARLNEQVRDDDTVARLGGDEFVIVTGGISLSAATALAERIQRSVAAPLHISGVPAQLTISVGIATFDSVPVSAVANYGTYVDSLLHSADIAMYQAKADGGDRCAVFE